MRTIPEQVDERQNDLRGHVKVLVSEREGLGFAAFCVGEDDGPSSLAPKIGRLAANSKLGDDSDFTSLGNSYRRVRVGPGTGL